MGKRSREKKEKADAERRARSQSNPHASDADSAVDSRRRFLIGALAAGGLTLAGARTAYEWGKNKDENKPDKTSVADEPGNHRDENEPASEYLSINEAVQVYHNLQNMVTAKWKEAQSQNKPLRILVLEDHESMNALAYELMLVDIASKLGIRTLLPELGSNTVQTILNADYREPRMILNKQQLLQFADKKNFNIQNIDTLYTSQSAFNQAYQGLTKRLAEEALQKRYNVSNLVVSIIPSKDVNSLLFESNISGEFNPTLTHEQIVDNGHILRRAKEKAYMTVNNERNKAMLANIKTFGNAVITMGQNHGMGIIAPLRSAQEIDVTFNVSDKASEGKEQNGPFVDIEKDHVHWAYSPANATQYTDKEFDPQNVTAFVNRVIEKARSRGISY